MRQSPPAGIMIFYACCKVAETNKELEIKAVFDETQAMYYAGFIIAANSIGLSQILIDLNTMFIKSVSNIFHNMQALLDTRISSEITAKNQFVIDLKAKIDEYFK